MRCTVFRQSLISIQTKQKTALIFWTNAPVIRKQNRQEGLKFHTRALGDNQGCLSVDVSFIIGLDAKIAPYASKKSTFGLLLSAMSVFSFLQTLRQVLPAVERCNPFSLIPF